MTDPQAAPQETDLRAVQWRGNNQQEIEAFVGEPIAVHMNDSMSFWTGAGLARGTGHYRGIRRVAQIGDWLLEGFHGEIYAIAPDTYADLLRRLARPDALRERVMETIEREAEVFWRDARWAEVERLKAAVAAVLEAENAD